jgi:glycosyltransferase involved in cell wall biosynthesis
VKILHVIGTLDPAAGGPPYVATRLAAAQAAWGHDVHILYYDGPRDSRFKAVDATRHGTALVRHALVPQGPLERWTATGAGQTLRSLIPGFDLVHLHEMWRPLLWVSAAIARRYHVPYVLTPHGMLDPWCLAQKSWKKRMALAFGWRRVLDQAAFLHVLNSDERRLLQPLGLTCPVETIPNGVFLDELQPAAPEDFFEKEYGFPGEHAILFLGRLHHKKGLDYLVAAVEILHRSLPEKHLVVAGPDEGVRTALARQIQRAGLQNVVHLVGPLYGDQKRAALQSAGCFCLPSRQEGFSIAILEAMASRLPVVISEACHFPEVAAAGAGRVVRLDATEIASALRDVFADHNVRRRMGDLGFDLVRSRYTWPKVAEQCISAYERLLP